MAPARVAAAPRDVEAVRRLFVLLKAASVYGAGNAGYRAHAAAALQALHEAGGAGGLTVRVEEEALLVNDSRLRPLGAEFAPVSYLLKELRARGVGALTISARVSAAELDAFSFAFSAHGSAPGAGFAELSRLLRDKGVTTVVLEAAGAGETAPAAAEGAAAGGPREASAARRAYSGAVETVTEVMGSLRAGERPDLSVVRKTAEELVERVLEDPQALFELSLIRRFDEYTYAHCVNVSLYALALGARLGLKRETLCELGYAGLFHDAGKARLPRWLIDKPDPFTESEWLEVRRHPALGARLLLDLARPKDRAHARAAVVAFEHHLAYDGSGYPKLPAPRRQDLFSRVCAIADAFDAMTSGRVYAKTPMPPDEAVRRLLQDAGKAFDPLLLRLFIGVVGVFPIGTLLLLDTDERAVVRRNRAGQPLNPEILLVSDSRGRALAAPCAPTPLPRRAVTRALDARQEGVDIAKFLEDGARP